MDARTERPRLSINGKQNFFKLDTGAEVTAISKEMWEVLGKPALINTSLVQTSRDYQSWDSSVVTSPTRANIHSTWPLWWTTSNQLARSPSYHSFATGSENRLPSNTTSRCHHPEKNPSSLSRAWHNGVELDRMEKAGVISKVTEPTEW